MHAYMHSYMNTNKHRAYITHTQMLSYKEIDERIETATKNRTVAATQMNATSSRAHTVVTITYTQVCVHACICVHACVCVHACICVHKHTHTQTVVTITARRYACICTYTFTHTYDTYIHGPSLKPT
jgi:hypothetical protein